MLHTDFLNILHMMCRKETTHFCTALLALHLLGQEMVKQAPELKSLMAMSKFSVDQDRSSRTGRQDDMVPGKGRLRGRKCEHRDFTVIRMFKEFKSLMVCLHFTR